jgi:hypothetical protein
MPELQHGEALFVHACVEAFARTFERQVVEVLAKELRGIQPSGVRDLREQLQLLMRQLESRSGPVRVHEAMAGLLKRVLLSERRRVAESLEVPLAKAIEPSVVGALHRELRRYDDLMATPWIAEAKPQRIPRLTDFLSIRFAAAATSDAPPLRSREYDENSPRPGSRLAGRVAGVFPRGAVNVFMIQHLTVLNFQRPRGSPALSSRSRPLSPRVRPPRRRAGRCLRRHRRLQGGQHPSHRDGRRPQRPRPAARADGGLGLRACARLSLWR